MEGDRAVILGSGNVATHLARALSTSEAATGGCRVLQVYSPHPDHARIVADIIEGCSSCSDISQIDTQADIYIISVKDDALPSVARTLRQHLGDTDAAVIHTSGSVPIDVLADAGFSRYAVMYPLQTFSRSAQVDMSRVPFFIEAGDQSTLDRVHALATSISQNVNLADSSRRALLHISAVFGCNFVNHMLDISEDILNQGGYSLDVLKPLVETTIEKAMQCGAHASQTGPARRADRTIIDKHLSRLSGTPREIYRLLSESIMQSYNPQKEDKIQSQTDR